MIVGWDIETNQLSPHTDDAQILTVGLADGKRAWGYLIDHPLDEDTTDEELTKREAEINRYITDPANTIVGHNIVAFDIPWWESVAGHKVTAQWFDTRVAYSLLNENVLSKENNLDYLARTILGMKKNEDELNRKRLVTYDPALVLKYQIQDAKISRALYEPLMERLEEEGLTDMLRWRMEVGRVLTDMTLTGIQVDLDWIDAQSRAMLAELAEAKAWLLEAIGRDVNLGSAKQLRQLLYDPPERGGLGAPVTETTPKGEASTSEEALKIIRSQTKDPAGIVFIDKLLTVRKLSKYDGTYLRPMATKHRGRDGRAHPTFNLSGTLTGRLSSSNPNAQNQPRDKRIKGALAATPGLLMFNADYSQLELRVAAWYSGEPVLLRAFEEGLDAHTLTLAEMEGKDYEWIKERLAEEDEKSFKGPKVWTEKRALIKRVNFLMLYGGSAYRLVKVMQKEFGVALPRWQAQSTIDKWFEKYSRMAAWIEESKDTILERGYVETPTGRRRRLGLVDPNTSNGQQALRQGVNFLVQSLAGELALQALLEVDAVFRREGGARLLVTVHDSIVGEYHPDDWSEEEITSVLKRAMVEDTLASMEQRFGIPPTIPLAVDVKVGSQRWE